MPDGFLTTHVLDTARGLPAAGLKVELWALNGAARQLLLTRITNADGRTDGPMLTADQFAIGTYELVFYAGDYFTRVGLG